MQNALSIGKRLGITVKQQEHNTEAGSLETRDFCQIIAFFFKISSDNSIFHQSHLGENDQDLVRKTV